MIKIHNTKELKLLLAEFLATRDPSKDSWYMSEREVTQRMVTAFIEWLETR